MTKRRCKRVGWGTEGNVRSCVIDTGSPWRGAPVALSPIRMCAPQTMLKSINEDSNSRWCEIEGREEERAHIGFGDIRYNTLAISWLEVKQ